MLKPPVSQNTLWVYYKATFFPVQDAKAAHRKVPVSGFVLFVYYFMWGFNGVEHIELDHGYQFHGEETTKGSLRLTGKISGENHPFINDFKFVKQFEEDGIEAKQTIPDPAQFLAELFRGKNGENTRKVYPNTEELIKDIAKAYTTFFKEIYEAGCRTLQLDDCTWGMIVDDDFWMHVSTTLWVTPSTTTSRLALWDSIRARSTSSTR